ncbi:histidine kinase [Mucilaginibacter sp.]|uniref:sensor histidine kinase n=1 Tax=Mucilaginibacter sp. TaxID=1882438 RepID=UPI002852881C|nr:histidine kinase [Mucilaginibacter sp.]
MKRLEFENLKLHIIFWTVFIVYELTTVYILVGTISSFGDDIGHYILYIALFYFNAHLILPTTTIYKKASYFLVPLGIITELVLYLLVKGLLYYIFYIFHVPVIPPYTSISEFIASGIFRGIYFVGLSTGYWFAITTFKNTKKIADLETIQLKNELQKQELEKTLLVTENAYLKSQINPHFLLNTLNFLYNSVSKYSEKIADSVMTLSDIMRYALTNADDDGKVWLESELDQINNFVKLNQARFNQRLNIELVIEGKTDGLRIIPLVLITLVENVFKYGDLLNENYPARIITTIDGGALIFITQNLKKKKVAERGYGIGIKNVKDRLAMYHQYELIIEDHETEYKSILKIEL